MAGAGAASAAFLAACGGGDDDDADSGSSTGPSGQAASKLLAQVQDTTSSAKPGGHWPTHLTQDLQSLDPYLVTSGSAHAPWTYSRLVRYKPGIYPENATSEVEPDGAQEWEEAPDGLSYTFKLNPDMKFDPRSPTSGRKVVAADVKFSAEKFRATGLSRSEFFNEFQPTSPVESVNVIDEGTVQVKMAFPIANMMARFAFQRYIYIMPTEADGGFDAANDMRGSAAWRLVKWEPSQSFEYARNDTWHLPKPFLDGLTMTIIPEYAQRRSQLVAGNLWTVEDLLAEDILAVKAEQPKLNLYTDPFPDVRPSFINFGLLDGSPFHDVRVRRAASMVLDRDLIIETIYNVRNFESAGLPVEARWHTHFAAGEPPYWIDPKGDGLGDAARWFQYDPDEAMKMVKAAGFETPLRMPGFIQNANAQVDANTGMMNDSGIFDIQLTQMERAEFLPKVFNGGGLHEGIAPNNGPGVSGDIDNHISVRFNVGAAPQVYYREVYPWYEKTQQLVEAQRIELDREKRLSILKDLQIEMADQMVAVPWAGLASKFSLAWPFMANFRAFVPRSNITDASETWPLYWYDASKA